MPAKPASLPVQVNVEVPLIPFDDLVYDPHPTKKKGYAVLGKGSFGTVYAGHYQGEPVAIKALQDITPKILEGLKKEAAVMARVRSPYTVALKGICDDLEEEPSLVMEKMEGGSLYSLLHKGEEALPLLLRYRLALEVVQGLLALHAQGILHCDLKSANILLDAEQHAKITDFGLSQFSNQMSSIGKSAKQSVGTLAYKAPELIQHDQGEGAASKHAPHTPHSDVYAFGVILWELFARKIPFSESGLTQNGIQNKIAKGGHETIPPDCPEGLKQLILSCWQLNPLKRPRTDLLASQLTSLYEAELAKERPGAMEEDAKEESTPSPWHIDRETFRALGRVENYARIPAGPEDTAKVVESYKRAPVAGKAVGRVEIVYSYDLDISFAATLRKLERRHNNPAFSPKWRQAGIDGDNTEKDGSRGMWQGGEYKAWRESTAQILSKMAASTIDPQYPHVTLLPMWHATAAEVLPSLFSTGFANLATVDPGFFGKGIYSAGEARYSHDVYGKIQKANGYTPVLLMTWVATYSPYPVIEGDKKFLEGKGNYGNHDAHFIPVRPHDPKNPYEINFYPCTLNQPYTYTEVVVFDPSQCLARYVVELQSDLLPSPAPSLDIAALQKAKVDAKAAKQAEKEAAALAQQQAAIQQALDQAEQAAKAQAQVQAAEHAKQLQEQQAQAKAEQDKLLETQAKAKAEQDKLLQEMAEQMKALLAQSAQAEKDKAAAEKQAENAKKAQEAADKKLAEEMQAKETLEAQALLPGAGLVPADEKDNRPIVYASSFALPKQGKKAIASQDPAVLQFLTLVAEGKQGEAEAMLQKNPHLALASGYVTDRSNRRFGCITGFQYAVWALDWKMWQMIRRYLPPSEAADQLVSLEADGTEHGQHFSLDPLIGALDIYIKNYDRWTAAQSEKHWCQQVGGSQLLLPVHIAQEYCDSRRSFYPCPNFNEEARSESLVTNTGDWYGSKYNGGKLGEKFGYVRGGYRRPGGEDGRYDDSGNYERNDAEALQSLSKMRQLQLEGLKVELRKQTPIAPQTARVQAEAGIKAQADKERAAFSMEIQKKAQAKSAVARNNPKLQDALIKACEEGDTAQAKQLLRQGASPTEPGSRGIHPLGAAVWGMNTEVVYTLLEEIKEESPMSWEECKAHNQGHYNEVFMFSSFAPKNWKEWHGLLLKMSRSRYLRELHLVEADKVWRDNDTSSWEKFVSYVRRLTVLKWYEEGVDLKDKEGELRYCQNSQAVFVGINAEIERKINGAAPGHWLVLGSRNAS